MLDSNVNLHSAGVAMYFAEVLIVLEEHRTVGLYLLVALSGAVTDVVIVHFNAHFTLCATRIACFWQTKDITFTPVSSLEGMVPNITLCINTLCHLPYLLEKEAP